MTVNYKVEGQVISFWLKVKPRSARERLTCDSEGNLRLEVHAPPVEGAATQACIRFFSRALHLPQACVTVTSGEKSRRKLIRIAGRSAEKTASALEELARPA